MKMVWCEIDTESLKVIRIFRSEKAMILAMPYSEDGYTAKRERSEAVSEIRHQVWEKTKGFCMWCAEWITEESMHMHEVLHRGQGGEISLKNSVGICAECHMRAHEDRNPRFGETV